MSTNPGDPSSLSDVPGSAPAFIESAERLLCALAAAGMVAWEWDLASNRRTQTGGVSELLGLDDCAGKVFLENVHPDDRAKVEEGLARAVREEASYDIEFRLVAGDGRVVWVADRAQLRKGSDGMSTHLVGICTVVSERRQAEQTLRGARNELELNVAALTADLKRADTKRRREIDQRKRVGEALRDSGERLRILCEMTSSFAYAFQIDRDAKIVRNWSKHSFARITGFTPEEVEQRGWENLLHPDDKPLMEARIEILLSGRPDVREWRITTKSGDTRWLRDHCEPMFGAPNSPFVQIFGAAHDITESKRAEEQARQLQADLAHLGRLSTMGEMASGLAHELNQPLTAIINYSRACVRMMRSGVDDRAELLHALEQTAKQAERAGEVIRRLRCSVARSEPHRCPVNLNDLVREAVRLEETELRLNSIRVQFNLAERLPIVEVDRIQIEQVLLNLIRNGIESMKGNDPGACQLTLHTMPTGSAGIEVAVRDTGCGLSPEIRHHLFEPFQTTKPGGMGLGLTISRSIILAHGGRLTAKSNPDRGTTVSFSLPVHQGAPRDVA